MSFDGSTFQNVPLEFFSYVTRAGHSRFFRAFALASAKLKKSAKARRKKSAKKSESAERERKKGRIRAFSVFAEHPTGSPVPGPNMANLGGGGMILG